MLSLSVPMRAPKSAAFRLLIVFICLLGCAQSSRATTVVLPPDDDLIIGARAIVRGRVTSIECAFDDEHRRILTYITLRVQEVIKGQIQSRFITIKELGGQVGSEGSIIFGSPQFRLDENVFLYLDTWGDGSLRVHQMFLGKFSIIEDELGRRLAIRDVPDAYTNVLTGTHTHEPQSAITNRMELSAYTAMVRERVAATRERAEAFEQTYYRNASILAAPREYTRGERMFQPQFNLIANPPPRWFEPDDGLPVVFLVNTDGMPSPQMMDAINAAMNAWSTISGSSLRVANGGTAEDCLTAGLNTLVFNNCDQRFAPSPFCAGVLAFGGLNWSARETKVVNGKTFYRGNTGHVSFNPYASCHYQDLCNAAEIITHELGHTLGLGHSWSSCGSGCTPPTAAQIEATMYPTAHFDGRCASLRQDDVDAILFVYPLAGGAPGPLAVISPSTLISGAVERDYSLQLLASGGSQPYSWSITVGQLPPGLNLSASGLISGKPTTSGSFAFSAQVRDSQGATAQKGLTLNVQGSVAADDSQFISQTVPARLQPGEGFTVSMKWLNTGAHTWNGINGFRMHSQNPAFNKTWGGDTLPLYFSVVPAGQYLDITFSAFAPRTPGTYNFQWQLYQEGVGFFGQMSENVSVVVSGGNSPVITSPSPVEGAQGQPFIYHLMATGGTQPYTWQITSGTLPGGLSLNAASGLISGTPAAAGATTVTIQVTDSESRTAQKSLSINIAPPPVEIITALAPPSLRGSPYSFQLSATGGKPPYNWQVVSGALPAGLSLAPASGIISGMPTAAGTFGFTVEARDSESRTARKALSINVTPPISLELATLVEATKGLSFSYQPAVSGGTQPYTWQVSAGTLPAGLALNASTGLISGTPTGSGLFTVGLTVRDQALQSAIGSFQIKVIDPETIPAITSAKYKAGKRKLRVSGERINPAAVLFIDGNQQSAAPTDGVFVVKRLTLASGQHEIRIVNPGNVSSQAYMLTIN